MLWVACARKLKKTREKKIRVAKFDNSDSGASVLIGLWGKTSHTNIFSNFRAVNFLVFSSNSSAKLPITFCLNKGIKVPAAVEEGDQQRQNHQRSADNDADNVHL